MNWHLKQVDKVIKFNQKAWLKSYIDTITELGKKAKHDFETFLSGWIIHVLEKPSKLFGKIET